MKKFVLFYILLFACILANSQNYYYVFFTDKNDVSFNPYVFFDQKAIERRFKNNLNLYDETDFAVNHSYIMQVETLSEDFVGESRWFNMVMLSATDENIAVIKNFSFVKEVVLVENNEAILSEFDENKENLSIVSDSDIKLSLQLLKMKGDYFDKNNISGKGVRIAVFDGGFPNVDKHEAFQHLRDNNRIIKTWNFPLKKENVYGWNSHGTMVLSCIAGIKTSLETAEGKNKKIQTKLGLACDSEFLLARTEINSEPKKEEFWWLQAVEWADKNGAQIINSSLGYGIHRYRYKDMDGHKSLVSQAARLAARKGILVCNSAGNEGSSKNWIGIITPADVDSVLTVGGITYSMQNFKRISFSSYGPTADGTMKPNVVAFGHAEVAKPNKINEYEYVDGTSFSSPLTAGFAACALQTHPNWTAMQLKNEIEKSANLYPYFDYAFGYGIPQANYFTEKEIKEIKASFEILTDSMGFIIKLNDFDTNTEETQYLFYNIQNPDGKIVYYYQVDLSTLKEQPENERIVKINGLLKYEQSLNVFYKGYYKSVKSDKKFYVGDYSIAPITTFVGKSLDFNGNHVTVEKQKRSKWGYNTKHFLIPYFGFSFIVPFEKYDNDEFELKKTVSTSINYGLKYKYGICKWYGIGANLGFSHNIYRLNSFNRINYVQPDLLSAVEPPSDCKNKYNKLYTNALDLEFFQRFRLVPTSLTDAHIDMGIYGAWEFSAHYKQRWTSSYTDILQNTKINTNRERLNYGVRLRIGYELVEIFAQYRLSNYFTGIQDLPRLNVGIQIMLGCY